VKKNRDLMLAFEVKLEPVRRPREV
jgi:hypothetical protein